MIGFMQRERASIRRSEDYFRGCLLGGAIGDALGWPVEFMREQEIRVAFGLGGVHDLVCAASGRAEITDDTQMTLFTAEGLLRAMVRGQERGICHLSSVVHRAYLRWLHTQGVAGRETPVQDGWLIGVQALHHTRAPGNSCLSALQSGQLGTVDCPINNSKGCGAVMRVAPVGLFCRVEEAFQIGMECGAMTHGHPSGYLSAGALAQIIAEIIAGADIGEAVSCALVELRKHAGHEECSKALERSADLASGALPPSQAIAALGQGWVGDEALAIAVYCSLKYPTDFRSALVAAVNHDGDSDSTGAITGNILGARLGLAHLPVEWVDKVELKAETLQVADDLLTGYREGPTWWSRYPGH